MSYARLNIWLRDLNCCPRNFWKVELVIKTCGGDYLSDFNPDVIDKLAAAYPEYVVDKGTRDGETVIRIRQPNYKTVLKHIEVEVPPGCYIVRAWVCWHNMWSDRLMVIVRCGEEACVNLLIPLGKHCIRGVMLPFVKLANEMKLPANDMRVAVDMLMRAGEIEKEGLRAGVVALTNELKESEAMEAPEYLKALTFMEKLIRGIKDDPAGSVQDK